MAAWARIGLTALLATGCYASHSGEPEGDVDSRHCVSPSPTGNPCGAVQRTLPLGACNVDGALIAFGDLHQPASCGAIDVDALTYSFEPHHCTEPRSKRRDVARCGDAAAEASFGGSPWGPVTFDLTEGSCAVGDHLIEAPIEPWRPFEPAGLCHDPYAWCGSPVVLELRGWGGGCGFTQRCFGSVESGRIVLRAETARRDWRACSDSDRTATCVVPPLGAGHYDVVDGEGRPLGAIEIPATQPIGDFEPTCTPIP